MHYVWQLGYSYLRAKKRTTLSVISAVAVTGVALGVAALLSVMSITSGFQEQFRNKVLGVNAHVLLLKYGLDFEEYRAVIAKAERLKEVAGAAPFRIDDMMLAKGDRVAGVLVKGIDPERMQKVLDLPKQMIRGSLHGLRQKGAKPAAFAREIGPEDGEEVDFNEILREIEGNSPGTSQKEAIAERPKKVPLAQRGVTVPTPSHAEASLKKSDATLPMNAQTENALLDDAEQEVDRSKTSGPLPGIVVGNTLARSLGMTVGDEVTVYSPLTGLDISIWKPSGMTPRTQKFKVIGIFEAGFQEYDSRLVYIDLYAAQKFFDQGDTVTGVEVRLHHLDKAPQIARKLERQMGHGPYHTMDWRELNHNLFTALEIQKVALSLVIATIILVAAFNVVATLIMIVLERKRQIAILKAMGAKQRSILAMFSLQGAMIGLAGTFSGLVLGGGVCAYLSMYKFPLDPKVYLVDHLPVRTSWIEFALTVVIALTICATATLLPSWWASRLPPVEGLRYE
ncbi:MAG: ABC transporter permease [Myxococcales bacterium]|nr:ABC transporter permease [Myxococcales bacterium]